MPPEDSPASAASTEVEDFTAVADSTAVAGAEDSSYEVINYETRNDKYD